MKKIEEVLNKEVGEYLLDNKRKFTNKNLSKILSDIGYKATTNALGEYSLSTDAVLTAILLKYLEYYNSDMDIGEFRSVWVNTKDGRFGGVDVIFKNVLEHNDNSNLSKVIALLGDHYHISHFEQALENARGISTKLGIQENIDTLEKKIIPAMSLYYDVTDKFLEQQKEFYSSFLQQMKINEGRK